MNSEQSDPILDAADGARAATAQAAICRRDDRIVVRMPGEDRVSFLHGMCSNEIKALQSGMVTYALILTDHAHVVADLYVWADDDALYLEVERGLWPKAREHLEKFLVADDVEIEEQEQLSVLDIVGPAAARAVAAAIPTAGPLVPWHFVNDGGRLVANLPRIGLNAFTVVIPTNQVDNLVKQVVSADPLVRKVGLDTLEIMRVERGVPRVGVDATERTLALEARLEAGISFNKGCYVGQETVERATARGGVKKRLYGLRIAGPRIPSPGATVWLDGKEVGVLTSVAASPRLGGIGLSILHHGAWKPGAAVTVKDAASETAAVVSDLPFE
jgi:folate-binding protein YgfZ